MRVLWRGVIVFFVFLILWQVTVNFWQIPPYLLPTPMAVLKSMQVNHVLLVHESLPTLIETVLGLILGIVLGCITAISMSFFRAAGLWLMPLVVVSQAIPTFAIAPLLVLWLGFGMSSKIATTVLMLFFPITSSFYDGLRQTDRAWLDLSMTMRATRLRTYWYLRIPAALPSLASGIRVATAIAPIGAVIGEWVGASKGLGFLMLNANARMQIDLMFAALFIIILFSLVLFFTVDYLLKKAIPWHA